MQPSFKVNLQPDTFFFVSLSRVAEYMFVRYWHLHARGATGRGDDSHARAISPCGTAWRGRRSAVVGGMDAEVTKGTHVPGFGPADIFQQCRNGILPAGHQ